MEKVTLLQVSNQVISTSWLREPPALTNSTLPEGAIKRASLHYWSHASDVSHVNLCLGDGVWMFYIGGNLFTRLTGSHNFVACERLRMPVSFAALSEPWVLVNCMRRCAIVLVGKQEDMGWNKEFNSRTKGRKLVSVLIIVSSRRTPTQIFLYPGFTRR